MTWCTFRIKKKKAVEQQSDHQEKPFRLRYIIVAVILLCVFAVYIYLTLTWEPKPDPTSEKIIRQAAAKILNKEPNDLTDAEDIKYCERN